MDVETVNNLGGACQIVGVVLVVSDLLTVTRYRGDLTRAAVRLGAWWAARVANIRRLLGRPGRDATVRPGTIRTRVSFGAATVGIGMRGPFTAQPGQSLEDQIEELALLVNQLRDAAFREPQERKRAIAEERQARQRELRAEAARLDAAVDALRKELKELREVTTGAVRLRWEGVPVLLVGVAFTTWPAGIAGHWPGLLPWRPLVLVAAIYAAARLTGALSALTAPKRRQ